MAAWRYKISRLVLKKKNFVSPRGHVISSIYTTAFEDEKCSVFHKNSFSTLVCLLSIKPAM